MTAAAHYFIFTSGEYSDYRVDGICVCDHPVSSDEWHAHLVKYRRELEKRQWEGMGYDSWDAWYDAGGSAALARWTARNNPVKKFIKLHKMRPVPSTEFNNDGYV